MAVKMLDEDEVFDLIKDLEMSPQLSEPRRCKTCEHLLVPRVNLGRLIYECPMCPDPTNPE